ncbi:RNA-guided endonuclease InsQ/TnpB family protein [[Mycobacterium] nativiensis]|uniref:RNA-guided endonuclease TnpB family protein n=1 Tax=[Mycobacterium] nativiensis TaxID=2855503 RepID=A0ABU5XZI3_9MYCO|nr:RNA-guided endonuclease TnpB family protein [Mycolicibacter sp. MYC340]MEB3033406.1 RNA-guided endonuclease TnpB family protein [Mycolicibacter sp. MYC340]
MSGSTAAGDVQMRAYRLALDPTTGQLDALQRHAGAARWAFNHALAAKRLADQQRTAAIRELVEAGTDLEQARRQITVKVPGKAPIQKAWNQIKGDSRSGVEGICPWWHEVSTYAFQSAFADADTAWQNWWASRTGRRAGKRVGQPRFKRKHRCRDSFRIHHDVKRPTIRPDGYRRLIVPRLGSIRLHATAKPLCRAIGRGAVIQSVTIVRGGHHWYASVLVKDPTPTRRAPTRRQRVAGTVGVDLGVNALAALSTGEIIDNPRHLRTARKRLLKTQRALSRTSKGSARRRRCAAILGRRHHEVSERRATTLHALTKRLTTQFETVAIEDLNVTGMTASARGTIEQPGRNVRAKAGLNRSILDVSPGELRRQLTYKTSWYGSTVAVCDRWYPSSKTCSNCGTVKLKLALSERVFHCAACGLVLNRDVNAARCIAAHAVVASGTGETLNARRIDTGPASALEQAVTPCADVEAGRPPRNMGWPPGASDRTVSHRRAYRLVN